MGNAKQWIRIKNGEQEALDELIQELYPKLYRFVYSLMRGDDSAKDITQETMLRFIDHMEEYEARCKMETYLCAIAMNLVRDHARKTSRYRERTLDSQDPRLFGYEQEETWKQQWRRTELMRYIHKLPQEQQEVILLRYYMQLKIKEIATMYHINPSTVKTRIRLALAKLKKEMEESK